QVNDSSNRRIIRPIRQGYLCQSRDPPVLSDRRAFQYLPLYDPKVRELEGAAFLAWKGQMQGGLVQTAIGEVTPAHRKSGCDPQDYFRERDFSGVIAALVWDYL
ncbi:MAG: hypothetical protein ABSC60_12425, partial [Acidobacteriota bacterium]